MTRRLRIGVVMDPIATIKPYKDTTLALLLAAQARGWSLHYAESADLMVHQGQAQARLRPLRVYDDRRHWHDWEGKAALEPLAGLDAILMRVDPPFDMNYIASTYVLERAEAEGVLVVNRPQSLRDCNEKLYTAWFPELAPPTLFARDAGCLRAFHAEHRDVIYKPLDGMGGSGIFRVGPDGLNLGSVIEQLSDQGRRMIVAQQYLPGIVDGDKRVLMIDGEPVPWCLARVPMAGETRGNLAAGGSGRPQPLSDDDRRIAAAVGPELRRRGLLFVGLDVIGAHLTEINVTSPTCAREIDAAYDADIGGRLMDVIAARCSSRA